MMILRSAPASPFGRKVKIVAALCGLSDRITIENTDTLDESDTVRQQNPLGKIPVLLLEDGRAIYDSRVIVEAMDQMAGGGVVLPKADDARLDALVLQALADGIMDASILCRYEVVWRPEDRREGRWVAHQEGKIARGLAMLEAAPPSLEVPILVGQVALACALGYLDYRFEGKWRQDHPRLVDWLAAFAAKVPAYAASAPHP